MLRRSARYLVRLDDACPTMRRSRWDRIEAILDRYGIKPMVAVIPANRDPKMMIEPLDPGFWKRVRAWQGKGWAIAQHGCDHVYTSTEGGLVPIEDRSEFAGLPLESQKDKIRKGVRVFVENQVKPDLWVAPAHSFDRNTLKALKEETSISVISDGIALFPYRKYGFTWVPQQMWRFRTMPFGIWTVCLHPNTISDEQVERMERFLTKHRTDFLNPDSVERWIREKRLLNALFSLLFWFARRLKGRS